MKLYNTRTKRIEVVTPLHAPEVTVYTCGPTVYDFPHIGNWFTFIRYDLLVRVLTSSGLNPKWVMNITDVGHLVSDADEGEDKLEKGAKREGKSAWDIAQFYTDYFTAGMTKLSISQPSFLPRATDHIADQISLIQLLEAKGYTYVISDGVYYDTAKFPQYGDFAQLDLDEQQAGARVNINPEKRSQHDFALWKFSPKDMQRDMEWDSPWGKGFPGWHLECSAISMKLLGETIDIHSGGIDHIPVHHTNEIAQSEAATNKPLAQYWMHTNHITVNGEKISKSLRNGITLEDIEAKGFTLEGFRLHVLESHYRSQSKFSWESLESAQNRLTAYEAMADLLWQAREHGGIQSSDLEAARSRIQAALANDLDTPAALAILSELENKLGKGGLHVDATDTFKDFLLWLDATLGIRLAHRPDIREEEKQLIRERLTARNDQNWAGADELRDRLKANNLAVRDAEDGTIWSRL